MKRWLSLTLLLGALLGLLGQEAALACATPVEQAAASAQMSADCAEMMGLAKPQPQPEKQPCQGMTPDCIAKMGCAVPVALLPPPFIDLAPQLGTAAPRQASVAPLAGRDTSPEPEPPAHLG